MIFLISERHVPGLNGEFGLLCGYWVSVIWDSGGQERVSPSSVRDTYLVTMVRLVSWWAQLMISVISERHVPGLNGESGLLCGYWSSVRWDRGGQEWYLCHL